MLHTLPIPSFLIYSSFQFSEYILARSGLVHDSLYLPDSVIAYIPCRVMYKSQFTWGCRFHLWSFYFSLFSSTTRFAAKMFSSVLCLHFLFYLFCCNSSQVLKISPQPPVFWSSPLSSLSSIHCHVMRSALPQLSGNLSFRYWKARFAYSASNM
jgi:hypothetical protein